MRDFFRGAHVAHFHGLVSLILLFALLGRRRGTSLFRRTGLDFGFVPLFWQRGTMMCCRCGGLR